MYTTPLHIFFHYTRTRDTHAHLCLALVRRLCAHVICRCRQGMRGTCYVCCRRSCL